ncbi:hypothetical protein EW146_g10253 [Bondarzewia mesenterica]|uniref:non-specific serine/threonine protein kinase n=1 Tax=Bondarzewia mesenterica TaxID=1095465 RepID=A0A4S4L0U6_9AGAM|nr:hypothetical protein EW146_g10253 [Bondarzewia mesenterica]
MITGKILFRPRADKQGVLTKDVDMLSQMAEYLDEGWPPDLLAKGERTHEYFDQQGRLKNVSGDVELRLHDILDLLRVKPDDRPHLEHFLKLMLHLQPAERATASQLLNHPWLSL